jgi:hypothetical protein
VFFLIIQVAQKKCEFYGGSGLVMKKDYYVRCQGFGWNSERNAVDIDPEIMYSRYVICYHTIIYASNNKRASTMGKIDNFN